MHIECPYCHFSKEVADNQLPPLPAKVTCPQCSKHFTLEASGSVAVQEPPAAQPSGLATPPPLPPSPEPPPAKLFTPGDDIPAGFWIRVLASIIDSVVLQVIGLAMGFGVQMILGMTVELQTDPTVALLMLSMSMVLSIVYYVFFTGYSGQTPGKMALRIKVVHCDGGPVSYGQAFVREIIGKFFSGVIFGIGYLMVAFRSDKRGLHDLIARTRVVKI